MLKLFLSDIDGCLSEPYVAYDLGAFAQLRAWARRAETDPRFPRIGMCTGRSYGYAEAVAQALDLGAPALFESGAGSFDLHAARITWHPALTPAVEAELARARAFLVAEVVPQSETISYDYGKRSQAGIVTPRPGECEAFLPAVEAFVAAETPALRAFHTPFSIDVIARALTKANALAWIARDEGLTVDQLAFIGDTVGDAGAIGVAGFGAAPANGDADARAAADLVTDGEAIDGVLQAYRECLRRNGVSDEEVARSEGQDSFPTVRSGGSVVTSA